MLEKYINNEQGTYKKKYSKAEYSYVFFKKNHSFVAGFISFQVFCTVIHH